MANVDLGSIKRYPQCSDSPGINFHTVFDCIDHLSIYLYIVYTIHIYSIHIHIYYIIYIIYTYTYACMYPHTVFFSPFQHDQPCYSPNLICLSQADDKTTEDVQAILRYRERPLVLETASPVEGAVSRAMLIHIPNNGGLWKWGNVAKTMPFAPSPRKISISIGGFNSPFPGKWLVKMAASFTHITINHH